MGQALQLIKPVGSINTDVDEKYLKNTDKRFALNSEVLPKSSVNTSAPSNVLLDYAQPQGNNEEINSYFSAKTNETYCFIFNDEGNHHIYKINGIDNTINIVLLDPLLNFSKDPKHKPRIHLFFNHNSFVDAVNKVYRKYLVWTDGLEWQGFLDIETSIATNGFRTSYFTTADRKQLWQLPVRPSLVCPYGDFLSIDPDDEEELSLPNKLKDNTWQLRTKFIYTDARPSAWSPISSAFVLDNFACNPQAIGLPRSIKLVLDAGGPHVETIVLAYRNCAGNYNADAAGSAEWYETAIINKYADCLDSSTPFYEREINPALNYDAQKNTIEYIFSNDGTCIPVDRKETDRNFINVPKTSFVLAPLNKELLLVNNVFGDDPVNCDALAQIGFSVEEQTDVEDCALEMATIKVAVLVHNFWRGNNEPIFINENSSGDTEGMTKYFGGLVKRQFLDTPFDDPGPYKQYFEDKTKDAGFIAYIEGTDKFCRMKQYKFNGSTYDEFIQRDFGDQGTRRDVSKDIRDNDYYFISMGEIEVVKGTTGIIRLASHLSQVTENYQATSTYVLGIYKNRATYSANSDVNDSNTDFFKKEIWFTTCDGDVDLSVTPFVVADLTAPYSDVGTRKASTAFCGYVKDSDGIAVPGAEVVPYGAQYGAITSVLTDHNGFYWAIELFDDFIVFFNDDSGVDINIEGGVCEKVHGGSYGLGHDEGRPNQIFTSDISVDTADYTTNYFQVVHVQVLDKNGLPIPGIVVSMEGQKSRQTGADGFASFEVRNIMPTYGSTHKFRLAPMQSGICYLTLEGCEPCIPQRTITLSSCFYNAVDITLTAFSGFNSLPLQRGLHWGGTFPLAMKLMDAAGRETFAEELGVVTLPSIQEKQSFNFSHIRWNILGPMNLPAEYVRMSLLIGKNRNLQDFVTWVADKVEFVDSAGGPASSASADKILISIRSLYDAQAYYDTGLNAKYVFKPGDIMEFIANGDGVIFNLGVKALQFPIEGDFNNRGDEAAAVEDRYSKLVISYSRDLSGLTAGALIKLFSPKTCEAKEYYYETCATIPLKNGEPLIATGIITSYDTYLVRRGIKYEDETHTYIFPFPHHSPSDFWGDHCIDRGRISITNPYRKRLQFGRMLVKSEMFLENSNYNGLALFIDGYVKTFSGEQRGDIVGVISMEQLLMMVCERDNMIVNTADGFARVDRSGQIVAANPDDVLSDAQSKIVGNFGCLYEDVGTIISGDGFVWWIDTINKLPVFHDWNVAKDASKNLTSNYFINKLQRIAELKALGRKIKIVSGFDPVAKYINTTFFGLVKPETVITPEKKVVFGVNGNISSNGGVNYSNADFRAAIVSVGPEVVRWPGGTIAATFDWTTGRAEGGGGTANMLDDVKLMVDETGCDILFTLNMCTRDVTDQLAMLAYAESIGIPIKYIELGNEYNNPDNLGRVVYPTATAYAIASAAWIAAIKAVYPLVLIACVGENKDYADDVVNWNDTILSIANPDAMVSHVYPEPDTFVFDGVADITKLKKRLTKGFISAGMHLVQKPIWFTEYNYGYSDTNLLDEESKYAVALTMTQVLNDLIEDRPGIKLMCLQNIVGNEGTVDSGTDPMQILPAGRAFQDWKSSRSINLAPEMDIQAAMVSPDAFVHSNHDFDYDSNETIAFDTESKGWPLTYSFTPEGYGILPHSVGGRLFITFRLGKPYLHRLNGVIDSNTFFGVACDEVLKVIVNDLPQKVKQFLVHQQLTSIPYFAEYILTSLGHESEIPPIRMRKLTEGKYDAEFLTARKDNMPNTIYSGAALRGTWMQITFVRENTINFSYGTIDSVKQKKYNVLDAIIFKFMLSEQSSYNTNNQ